jgi:hypothetical protein
MKYWFMLGMSPCREGAVDVPATAISVIKTGRGDERNTRFSGELPLLCDERVSGP